MTFVDIVNVKQPKVFESVFHRYYASLCYFANKFVHDEEAARDIVQEVFLRFWESQGKFANETALKSYLYLCVRKPTGVWNGKFLTKRMFSVFK